MAASFLVMATRGARGGLCRTASLLPFLPKGKSCRHVGTERVRRIGKTGVGLVPRGAHLPADATNATATVATAVALLPRPPPPHYDSRLLLAMPLPSLCASTTVLYSEQNTDTPQSETHRQTRHPISPTASTAADAATNTNPTAFFLAAAAAAGAAAEGSQGQGRAGETVGGGAEATSHAFAEELGVLDEEQAAMMAEECILVDRNDRPTGSASKVSKSVRCGTERNGTI